MIRRLKKRYYIFRRDMCVRRLLQAGISGSQLIDDSAVAFWQDKILKIKN